MEIKVEIDPEQIARMVRQRIAELFSDDNRYREGGDREMVRRLVDESAVESVRLARDSIKNELPAMAEAAVRQAVQHEIEKTAKRGLGALQKLYAGFDPNKLTPEQRIWLEKQIAAAGKKDVEGVK